MTTADIAKIELFDALLSVKKDRVLAAVSNARPMMGPTEIIDTLAMGMQEVGTHFERGKLFLPHVISAADAMDAAVSVLERDLPRRRTSSQLPAVVIGTIEDDVHDIGKTIVSTMLQCAGTMSTTWGGMFRAEPSWTRSRGMMPARWGCRP